MKEILFQDTLCAMLLRKERKGKKAEGEILLYKHLMAFGLGIYCKREC